MSSKVLSSSLFFTFSMIFPNLTISQDGDVGRGEEAKGSPIDESAAVDAPTAAESGTELARRTVLPDVMDLLCGTPPQDTDWPVCLRWDSGVTVNCVSELVISSFFLFCILPLLQSYP